MWSVNASGGQEGRLVRGVEPAAEAEGGSGRLEEEKGEDGWRERSLRCASRLPGVDAGAYIAHDHSLRRLHVDFKTANTIREPTAPPVPPPQA